MNATSHAKAELMVYFCGGMAANVGMPFLTTRGKKSEGFAQLECVFIDTSRSNLPKDISNEVLYVVPDLDGAGKVRSANYEVLADSAADLLNKFRPGKCNIVVHSAAGGTGSTAGPVIVSSLTQRGEATIVLLVGSTSSRIEVENTIKTIKSYEAIAKMRGTPVIAAYRENQKDVPRANVDSEIVTLIGLIGALFSGQNKELDSADLQNFLNYTRVTKFPPALAHLAFYDKSFMMPAEESVITLTTLCQPGQNSDPPVLVEYQATGFIHPACASQIKADMPIHLATTAGFFSSKLAALEQLLAEHGRYSDAVKMKSVLGSDDKPTPEGLVL